MKRGILYGLSNVLGYVLYNKIYTCTKKKEDIYLHCLWENVGAFSCSAIQHIEQTFLGEDSDTDIFVK